MTSIRQNRVSRLIQKELGLLLQLHTEQIFHGSMITVTIVRVSPDLGYAKIYLSLFPPEKRDEIFVAINNHSKHLRYELGQKIGKQVRIVPELTFYIDDSLDYIENIERLIK